MLGQNLWRWRVSSFFFSSGHNLKDTIVAGKGKEKPFLATSFGCVSKDV